MDATVLVMTDLERDGQAYAERLHDMGFTDIVHSRDDHLRAYLGARPELVVLDLLSGDEQRSLLGSLKVGGWRSVPVPVIVVADDLEPYYEAGADAVVTPDQVDDLLAMTAVAVYAERCRRLAERARVAHPAGQYVYGRHVEAAS